MTSRIIYAAASLLAAASLIATIALWPRFPEMIPSHWNVHGQVNGYSPKWVLLVVPGIMALMMLLTWALPWLSPKHFELESFRGTYLQIMLMLLAMAAYMDGIMLWAALGHPMDAGRATIGGISLFLVLFGNVMGKVRRNFYLGIRTPWALANDRVWNATHRFAGKTMVLCGLAGVAFAALGLFVWTVGLILAGVLAPAAYSLYFYKRLEHRGEL